MPTITRSLGRAAAVLLGAAVATAAIGEQPADQAVKPAVLAPDKGKTTRPAADDTAGVHKMEIYEGPNRKVRYYGGGSPGERTTLNELERAENEMDYVHNLMALKRQYVTSERTL